MSDKYIYEIDGQKDQILQLYEDRCVILTKGGLKSLFSKKKAPGEKVYYFKYVTDIHMNNKTSSGKITFEYADPEQNPVYESNNFFEFGSGFATPMFGIVTDQMDHVFKDLVERWKSVVGSKPAMAKPVITEPAAADSQPQSVADELLKFKQLLDMGAITQEEFEDQKKKLLHL